MNGHIQTPLNAQYRRPVPGGRPAVGRLAPSPTGRLHLGNLSTFMLTWLQSRRQNGTLVMRIEDLDPPRVVDGAELAIVRDLKLMGLSWDLGPGAEDIGMRSALQEPPAGRGPWRQSSRYPLYLAALAALDEQGLTFPCTCSRREVREVLSAPHEEFPDGMEYPGTCRPGDAPAQPTVPTSLETIACAVRAAGGLSNPSAPDTVNPGPDDPATRFQASGEIVVSDMLAPEVVQDISRNPGDFVIRRRDGLVAYQLAVVVDDIDMGVTDVVRGRDLLSSTPQQIALFRALGAEPPRWWHVPVLTSHGGERLSKRAGSTDLDALLGVGWTPPLLRGALALLWGWTSSMEPRSTDELLSLFDARTLKRARIEVDESFFDGPDAWR